MGNDFFRRRFMKRLINEYGELDDNRKIRLIEIINDCNIIDIDPTMATTLYRLIRYSDDIVEIKQNFQYWVENRGTPYKDNTLEQCEFLYGSVYGKVVHEERRIANSERTKLNTHFNKVDKYEIAKLAQEGVKHSKEQNEFYDKERNKFCVEYYLKRGVTDINVIDNEIKIHKEKCRITKKHIVGKFGIEHWNAFQYRRKAAIKNAPFKRASKESLIFFEKVLSQMCEYESLTDIRWAVCDKGEFRIEHGDKDIYVDLCFPEYQIIVEYHGYRFHPISQVDEVYNKHRPKSLPSSEIQWEWDRKRANIIRNLNFTLYEIYSIDLPQIETFAQELDNAIRNRRNEILLTV